MTKVDLSRLRRPWVSSEPAEPGFTEGFQDSPVPRQLENVTLFTDASFDRRTGDMGGAWWAVVSGDKLQGKSRRRGVTSSAEAEVRVFVGAVMRLLEHPRFLALKEDHPHIRLIAVVDALAIRDAFNRPAQPLGQLTVAIQDRLRREGIHLQFNHVKAHNPDGTPRSHVNQWCDENARAARMSLREPS